MSDPSVVAPRGTPLTRRERQVLRAIWETGKETAAAKKLRISPHTVRTHTQNARSRLGVSTNLAAIRESGVYAD